MDRSYTFPGNYQQNHHECGMVASFKPWNSASGVISIASAYTRSFCLYFRSFVKILPSVNNIFFRSFDPETLQSRSKEVSSKVVRFYPQVFAYNA